MAGDLNEFQVTVHVVIHLIYNTFSCVQEEYSVCQDVCVEPQWQLLSGEMFSMNTVNRIYLDLMSVRVVSG